MSLARGFALTLARTFVTVIGVSSFATAGTTAEAPKTPATPTDAAPLSSSYEPYLIHPVYRYDTWYDRDSGRPVFLERMEEPRFGRKLTKSPDK